MSAPPEIGVMPRVAATEIQVWWSPPVQDYLAVAVGNNWGSSVCIATSTDGITWTDASNNPFTFAYGIAYSPSENQWVAVGSYGYSSGERMCIATSTDGMTWTDSSNNPFLIAYGIGWSESLSQWVAVGRNEAQTVCITTSSDGMTWTDASNNPFSGGGGQGIAYSPFQDKWVAVGYNSTSTVSIATSTDGMTWTDASNNPFDGGEGKGIAYSGSYWVAVGFNSEHTVSIATSTDGMTWTDASNNPFSGGGVQGIAYSQNKWVAVGTNSDNTVCIATSPDGMTWTDSSNNPFDGGYADGIAYSSSGNYWVAVGRNSDGTVCVARSTDGITWTALSNNPFSGGDANGIAFSSSPPVTNYVIQKAVPYVGVNESNGGVQLVYSGDGVKWIANDTILENASVFAYGNGMWLASGDSSIGQIYYSSDGLTWKSSLTFPICIETTVLIYRNGIWLAGINSLTIPVICYSTDGLIWIAAQTTLSQACWSIDYGKDNYGNNLWVASGVSPTVGANGIAYSTDGIHWTADTNNSLMHNGQVVAYGKDASENSLWLASGVTLNSGYILTYSYNGKSWYYSEDGLADISQNQINSITYRNEIWVLSCVAYSNSNVLYYSYDGLTWTPSTTANALLDECLSVIFSDKWIASGNNIIYSADGITWYPSSQPLTSPSIKIAYGDTNPIIIPAAESKGTYTVTGLTPLTDYTYMIQADCSGSYSDIAVYRTVKTSGRPQPVTSLTKTQSIVDGQLRVRFDFTNPSDYAQYYVYGLRVKGESDAIYEGQDITTIGNSYTFVVDPTREYTFHIQRGNDAGYSSMVSIDTVATTFDPRSVPGLWLWLDANDVGNGVPVPVDTEFSVWKDKSGKENDAVLGAGAAPASVTDGGVGKHVSIGSTWFNLTKSSWAYNQYFTFFVVENASTASSEIIYIGNRNNGADKIKIGYTNDGSIIFSTYADNTTLGSTTGIANAPPMNVMCFTNYGGKIAYWNKSVSGKNTSAANSFIVDSLLTIGVPTNVGRSEVYEVLMYRGIMKEDDREAITNYLYDKWIPRPSTVIQGPVQNGMIMWLDGADKDTMKDASGASVVVDGDLIYQWNDKSGQGNDIFDLAGTSQYHNSGINSFSGFGAGEGPSTGNIIQTNDATLFLVIFAHQITDGCKLFTHDVSGNYGLIVTATGISWCSGPTANNNEFKATQGRPFMFYGTIKKGQLLSGTFIDQDGVQKGYSIDSFSYSTGSSPIQLDSTAATLTYGEVIYYNRALSDSELQVNAEYLANKWGFSLAEPASAPRLPGLKLWLDSSDPYTVFKTGSTVTAWHDKSGLENNAVAYGAPTAGGGITFHGSDYFSLPDGALPRGDYSYYIVSDFSSSSSAIVSGGAKDVVGMWVAVGSGSGSTIQISYDGMTWTQSTNNPFTGGYGNGIAYSGSQWVAVGTNSDNTVCIASSQDGMTWTDASNNPFPGGYANAKGISYSSSQNKWVAVGGNSNSTVCIATSTDGMTWTDASNNPFPSGYANAIAYSSSQDKWVAVGAGAVCIATSSDGMTWTDASNNPFYEQLGFGIAWGANQWVAVGYNSSRSVCIATSPDGMTWTDSSNNPFSGGGGQGIAYSQNKWVAVGYNSGFTLSIASSTDGMTWTNSSNNPFSGGAGQGIGYSSSQWVAVGSGSGVSVAMSTDGITWTPSTNNPFSGAGRGIAYGEGDPHALNMSINVITDSSGTFAQTVYDYSSYRKMLVNASLNYSYDSVTWYDASGGNQLHDSIFYANGLWVAVGGYGFSYVYSNDGINWVNPGVGTNGFSADKAYAIVYANGLWIAGGTYTEGGSPITYSSNGINWNAATISDLRTCNSIAYGKDSSGNDLWIAGGDNVEDPVSYPLHYSANGMTWQTVSGSDALIDNCAAVVYGKGIWLAGGEGANTMIYSLTGYNWIPDISGSAVMLGACNSIALGKDLSGVELFVASGGTNGEYLAYSYNGLAWQTCIHDISLNTFGNVSYSNGLWLCPSDPTLAISYDGITWISSGVQNVAFTIIAGGRGAVTENKSILTDSNAILYGLEMGWVAVGYNSDYTVCIATSTDGITWTQTANPFLGGAAQGIAWSSSQNKWVAVGYNSDQIVCIATSPDGMTWTDASNNPFSGGSGQGIAYSSQDRWIAVGKNSNASVCIATSTDGMTWTDASNNPFPGGYGIEIEYNGYYWVAVGYNAANTVSMASSLDGITWTDSSNNPFSGGQAHGIAYSSNKWVAVGYNLGNTVCIASSTDGMSWTDASNNPFSGAMARGIAYSSSANRWVAVGNNSGFTVCIATSPDGMTWTDASNNPFSGGYGHGIAYSSSQNKWVAVGYNSGHTVSIATSPDGMTWTDASNNPFSTGNGMGIAEGMIASSQTKSKTVIIESINGTSRAMFLSGLTGSTDSAPHVQDSTQNYIGWDLSGGYMHGTIKEMLVYNTPHDGETRLQVEQYLKNKWFPTAFKPTDISGASLWLDASEENFIYGSKNRIQTWKDKTGNCVVKQDVPWAQPIYSLDSVTGLRGVQFGADAIANGLVDISGSPFGSGNSWSVFTVHRYDYSTDLSGEAVNGNVCTVYESVAAPTPFKVGSTYVTLDTGVPSELNLTEDISTSISADVRGRPVMTGQVVNSLTPAHTVNGTDYPGGGLIVAVGWNSSTTLSIATSTDGITWTEADNNPFYTGRGIAYNGSYWVAVGSGEDVYIVTSTDGIVWTDSSNNPFEGGQGFGIAWGGSKWVAVGQNVGLAVCIATSTDGMTWIDASTNPFYGGAANGIAWSSSQNKWVAVGQNVGLAVCIATSTDGMIWTDSSNNPFEGGQGFGIAWGGSKWVAVGYNLGSGTCIASSPDGMTWTDCVTAGGNDPFSSYTSAGYGIAFSGSQWVAVGRNSVNGVCIASSPDGITWTDSSNNPFFGNSGQGISYSSTTNQWIAVGAGGGGGRIATSPDGMTWTSQNNTFDYVYGVAASPPPSIQPMANARMNIGFTAPLTPSLSGAMRGYIYEILCYRGAVSPSDQQKIEGYLAWKWGIQDSLPGAHPYYLGPP